MIKKLRFVTAAVALLFCINSFAGDGKLQDEQDKLLRVNTDDSRKNEAKDLYLDETLNVMKDWLELKRPEMKLSAGQRESR